jgi:hypothetical protein
MIGALIGGIMGMSAANKQAKAIKDANKQNNQYINAAMPYMKGAMGDISGAYQGMVGQGPYSGPYYAGVNPMQTTANTGMYNFGMANTGTGQNLMDQSGGFGSNSADLYNQFQGMANRPDMMADASQYATDNMNPIVQAMMRDDSRRLNEQTLPGINMAASGSGNTNSSRAGVADALANRAYDDRFADVSTDVYNSLRDARLAQGNTEFNQANTALSNAGNANNMMANNFNTGLSMASGGFNTALGAGNNQNAFDQGQIDADKGQFDYTTGYNYNLGKDYLNTMAANKTEGNYAQNPISPGVSALSGAMSGMGFQNQYMPNIGNSSFFNPMFGGGPGLGGFAG